MAQKRYFSQGIWLRTTLTPGAILNRYTFHFFGSRLLLATLAVLILILSHCAPRMMEPSRPTSPVVRVGLIEHAKEIYFKPDGGFFISSRDADRYRAESMGEWIVRVGTLDDKAARYTLQISRHSSRQTAQDKVTELRRQGIAARFREQGDALRMGDDVIAGESIFMVYTQKRFDSREAAEAFREQYIPVRNATIHAENGGMEGELVLKAPSGKTLRFSNAVRLAGAKITLSDVAVGTGYHWSRKESRTFAGEMELRIDDKGKITAVNVLTMSDYLKGVLPGEMSPTFPLEALKAQAIAARTFFLHQFGRKHPNDPFDVCADVHCQAYVGLKNYDEKIDQAVRETRGIVMMHEGRLCETPYSAVCGGHTEHAQNVWNSDGQPYLVGVFDVKEPEKFASFDLSTETNVRRWIESAPTVFCNVENGGDPGFASYAKKFFRWEVEMPRTTLETSLKNYIKDDFGALLDLQPVERGVSGRLKTLRVVGTRQSFLINKELNIRRALSSQTLFSACIVIDKISDGVNLPSAFRIQGAGWGHGVGMCQIGAALMALNDKSAGQILMHYYQGINFKKLY